MNARIPIHAVYSNENHIARRDAIDLLRSRIDLLAGRDRLIMRMYFDNGASARRIAALLDVSASTIGRRIRTLSKRLLATGYRNCIHNNRDFTAVELQIARDHFVRGLSLRAIAAERNCSVYRIRETIRKIKLVTEITTSRRSDRPDRVATGPRHHTKDESRTSEIRKGTPAPA